VMHVLDAMQGNKTASAKVLGFERKTLYRKLIRWGVSARDET
jgi:transcriptional regulator of acetoin/glycerol metabolism